VLQYLIFKLNWPQHLCTHLKGVVVMGWASGWASGWAVARMVSVRQKELRELRWC